MLQFGLITYSVIIRFVKELRLAHTKNAHKTKIIQYTTKCLKSQMPRSDLERNAGISLNPAKPRAPVARSRSDLDTYLAPLSISVRAPTCASAYSSRIPCAIWGLSMIVPTASSPNEINDTLLPYTFISTGAV